jgi:hypothetical protein
MLRFKLLLGFLFNSLDNHSIDRITEKYTITRDTSFIPRNPHGGENPTKTSLIKIANTMARDNSNNTKIPLPRMRLSLFLLLQLQLRTCALMNK